ncbi:hypothetical protein A3A56_03470 [Candidatus Roizmanbacteria bacterium RIFCSPLOWO2_01_FULL_40_32]|nr:MAG: hypothetical protein A3A56_03470 [Candidatus Roizmanbacteria bacterium RIFCSPLOWO2_01_FULL_40_32]
MQIQTRHIDSTLLAHFKKNMQIMILLGPRQAGKTTLITRLFPDAQYFLVDNEPILKNLETYDIHTYRQIIRPDTKTLIIDEIQLLSNPGRCAKIIHDQLPDIQLIITGSSALTIKNKTSESLAGRKVEYHLYPLTFSEYLYQKNSTDALLYTVLNKILAGVGQKDAHLFDLTATLETFLLFGGYPYLIQNPQDVVYLDNLVDSVVFKDILELELIENRKDALNLLKLLAHQMSNLINYAELANRLQIDVRTVKKYIEIFEQSFIIFRLYPFSKNKRDEIVKSPKIYFFDTGLRNALIKDFSDLLLRTDRGALFENLIVSEVFKSNHYRDHSVNLNYWRTKQGAEIDLVLSGKDLLIGVEIKYGTGTATKVFKNRYTDAKVFEVTAENFY